MQQELHPLQRNAAVIPMAVASAALWATASPSIKVGYQLFLVDGSDTASQLLFAGLRFLLAGLMTLLPAALSSKSFAAPEKDAWAGVILLGLVQTGAQYLFFYIGLAHTTGIKGSILTSTAAFLGVLAAHFFCPGERMNLWKTAGCIVGFAGVVALNLNGGEAGGGFSLLGDGFVLLAAASQAISAVISQRVTGKTSPLIVSGWQLAVGGGVLLVVGVLFGGHLQPVGWQAWLLLVYMAFLSAAAFALWTLLLKFNPVGKISIYQALIPVLGTMLCALLLKETFSPSHTISALILVCSGIWMVNHPTAVRERNR